MDTARREVVVVTGASAGVGRAIVKEFAERGARIGLIARGIDGLEGAKHDVEELGGEALVLPLDVSDADAVERAATEVEETFGPIDVWVNNAMVSVFSSYDWYTDANLHRKQVGSLAAILIGALAGGLKKALNGDERKKRHPAAKKKAAKLSETLREGDSKYLRNRRSIVALSTVASASLALIALYQMGIIKHIPEPPLPMMDADEVDASAEAYEKFQMPDAILGLGSYAATMSLAAMGGTGRHRTMPWIPLALAAKVAFDVANAAKLSVDQWTKHKAFCFWCLIAAGATFATVPFVIEESRAAWRVIEGKPA